MKSAIIMLLLATTMAQAQQPMPKTIRLFNNATKETIGTMTLDGNRAYLRDKDGILYGTIEQNADGTRTLYDPNGKVIEASSLNLPKLPE